jgi:hypothetical protein
MSIPNPVFRYTHDLVQRLRKKKTEKDLEEISNIVHFNLDAARIAAINMRNASVVLGAIAEKENKLSTWKLAEKLGECAVACESAVKMGGGYMTYED